MLRFHLDKTMRFVPTLIALVILIIIAMCAAGCSSVTYHDPAGSTLHMASFFGDAKVAKVTAAGITVEGFEAKNEGATRKYLNAWTIGKLIPLGGELINSTETVVTQAIKH